MRFNTPREMEFQKRIVDVFIEYDDIGFPQMADVMLAWVIHEMRLREKGRLTYWQFIKIVTLTWRDLTKLQARNNPLET